MDIDKQIRHDEHSDHEHSDEDCSFEDLKGMPMHMGCPYMKCCPHMKMGKCPFMYGMMPYKQMGRDEDDFEDDFEDVFEDEFDDTLETIMPMHRPRCRWPFRPCWYGGRWHCCRRRRPRPTPYGVY